MRGATFLLSTPTDDDPNLKHLFVLLTNPVFVEKDSCEKILLAGFSSARSGNYDKTCIINKGEHPFLRQKIYVAY